MWVYGNPINRLKRGDQVVALRRWRPSEGTRNHATAGGHPKMGTLRISRESALTSEASLEGLDVPQDVAHSTLLNQGLRSETVEDRVLIVEVPRGGCLQVATQQRQEPKGCPPTGDSTLHPAGWPPVGAPGSGESRPSQAGARRIIGNYWRPIIPRRSQDQVTRAPASRRAVATPPLKVGAQPPPDWRQPEEGPRSTDNRRTTGVTSTAWRFG